MQEIGIKMAECRKLELKWQNVQSLRKVFRPFDIFNILLRYSLILKMDLKKKYIYTQYPHDKAKTGLENLANLLSS